MNLLNFRRAPVAPLANGLDDLEYIPEFVEDALEAEEIFDAVPVEITHGKLLADRGATYVSRDELNLIETPPATDTFKPVSHHKLVSMIEETLHYRRISIVAEEFAVSSNGMKLFGLLELSFEEEGVRFALGIRTANDKSMRLSMVAGYRVMVCSNMAFSGEFKPLAHKHTKGLELLDSLSIAIDRTQRHFDPLAKQISAWKNRKIEAVTAKEIIYDAFLGEKFPIRLLRDVNDNYFGDERFERGTFWTLSNAGTSALKLLPPDKQYEATAKWGAYLKTRYDQLPPW